MSENKNKPRVVIVGAGFGGLTLARALSKAPVEVVLIDRNNYHTFQPLLYQVATAGLEPEEIAHAVRGIFHRRKNIHFRMGTVTGVDWEKQQVILEDGTHVPFDFLVLAAGVTTNFYGVEGAEQHAFKLKRLEQALELRSHIINQFERADQDPSVIDEGALNFVVVGGGPTGVEMSGALVELFHKVLYKDYPRLPMHRVRVILVEASASILGTYHPRLQQHAIRKLSRRGVDVRRGEQVVRATDRAVYLKNGEVIPVQTLIWTAGVRVNPLADILGLEQTTGGRVEVAEDLSVPGRENVFVIGDMAASRDATGALHPQLAPVAMQGARHVAEQIIRRLKGQPTQPFVYHDRGSMATIGRNSAIAEFKFGLRASGFIAWMIWLFLHLIELIGFRNRLNVLVNWIWNYFTYDRGARLIMSSDRNTRSVRKVSATNGEVGSEKHKEQPEELVLTE